jgi:hypothetical protein
MMYTFGRSYHRLEVPDFDPANHDLMYEGSKMLTVMKHTMWLFRIVQSLPEFVLSHLSYDLATLVEIKNVLSTIHGFYKFYQLTKTLTRVCESKSKKS